jgi:PAS domain S-box-containing protein
VNTYQGPGSVDIWEHTLRVSTLILFLMLIIFYMDIITPLGLTVWILYFIPLFLTLYLEWRYGPYVATGIIIILISISLFLSPRDVSLVFAALDRLLFCVILVVSTIFIMNYKKFEKNIRSSEERYRTLVEWSPDAVVVYCEGVILYANPASVLLFGADYKEDLINRDFLDMVQPTQQQILRQRISQATFGARLSVPNIGMIRRDSHEIMVDISLGKIYWDDKPAVLIILRVRPVGEYCPIH